MKRLDKIETQPKGETAADKLIKIFEDRVKEYKDSAVLLFAGFIIVMITVILLLILFWWKGDSIWGRFDPTIQNSLNDIIASILYIGSLTISGFGTWLLLFLSNRRAESKKLEEIYKHKEIMARIFCRISESPKETSR